MDPLTTAIETIVRRVVAEELGSASVVVPVPPRSVAQGTAAEMLGCLVRHIQDLLDRDDLEGVHTSPGGGRRVVVASLDAYVVRLRGRRGLRRAG